MGKHQSVLNILHICDYTAPYRGNFIDSLASIEQFHDNVKTFYLFPNRAKDNPDTLSWIAELNEKQTVAFVQEKNALANAILLARIIHSNKIQCIIRHFSDNRMDVLVKLLFNGKHVIRFFHSRLAISNSAIKQCIRRFLWRNNKLVGVSDSVADELRAAFPDYYVTTIFNAINFERLNKVEALSCNDRISLMMMGWDRETKGVDLAIRACEKLQKEYRFVLRIVSGRDAELTRNMIKDILGEIVDWIEILPPTNNVGTYYAANDIFLSPSRHEAFGYANVEAAYSENSIVLTRVGGQSQLKIEGAYWVEPNNIDDLAEKIKAAIIELKTPQKVEQRARVKLDVQRVYSLKDWSAKVVSLVCTSQQ